MAHGGDRKRDRVAPAGGGHARGTVHPHGGIHPDHLGGGQPEHPDHRGRAIRLRGQRRPDLSLQICRGQAGIRLRTGCDGHARGVRRAGDSPRSLLDRRLRGRHPGREPASEEPEEQERRQRASRAAGREAEAPSQQLPDDPLQGIRRHPPGGRPAEGGRRPHRGDHLRRAAPGAAGPHGDNPHPRGRKHPGARHPHVGQVQVRLPPGPGAHRRPRPGQRLDRLLFRDHDGNPAQPTQFLHRRQPADPLLPGQHHLRGRAAQHGNHLFLCPRLCPGTRFRCRAGGRPEEDLLLVLPCPAGQGKFLERGPDGLPDGNPGQHGRLHGQLLSEHHRQAECRHPGAEGHRAPARPPLLRGPAHGTRPHQGLSGGQGLRGHQHHGSAAHQL